MKVKELLDSPEKWTQRANARDSHNLPVNPECDHAACWCLIGAIIRCYPLGSSDVVRRVDRNVGCYVNNWNDAPERTFDDVKQLVEELNI